MFVLHTSNRTELLAEQLAAVISHTGGQDLFTKSIFLVQSREMERMLSQFLADRYGVWGNSKYLLPMQFIEHLCQLLGLDLDSGAFERSILIWRLELLLRNLDDRAMLPLRAYLSGPHNDLKRYQFARQLAHLFDQYQIMRPELISSMVSNNVLLVANGRFMQSPAPGGNAATFRRPRSHVRPPVPAGSRLRSCATCPGREASGCNATVATPR